MIHIQWGTLIYQIITFTLIIGIPFTLLLWFASRRKNKGKIKELEQRIERLEKEQK